MEGVFRLLKKRINKFCVYSFKFCAINLNVVKDGIEKAIVVKDGVMILNTNYYCITYNFEPNEGYIKKGNNIGNYILNLGKAKSVNIS
jgi:hypothetical protein